MRPALGSGRSRPSQGGLLAASTAHRPDLAPPRSSAAGDGCAPTADDWGTVCEVISDAGEETNHRPPLFGEQAMLILQRQGHCRVVQGARSITLVEPDLLFLALGQPLTISRLAGSRQVVVCLPTATVRNWSPVEPRWSTQVIRGSSGIGAALASLIASINACRDALEGQQREAVWTAVSHLVIAALGSGLEHRPASAARTPPPQRLPATTAKPPFVETIEQWLADPGLSPARVAARHDVSVRHLHRLFRRQGTSFNTVVRNLRLERCREDLANPRLRALPITEIAFRWGFSDSAHFSRCFRAAFGCTAREVRANRALAGSPIASRAIPVQPPG